MTNNESKTVHPVLADNELKKLLLLFDLNISELTSYHLNTVVSQQKEYEDTISQLTLVAPYLVSSCNNTSKELLDTANNILEIKGLPPIKTDC